MTTFNALPLGLQSVFTVATPVLLADAHMPTLTSLPTFAPQSGPQARTASPAPVTLAFDPWHWEGHPGGLHTGSTLVELEAWGSGPPPPRGPLSRRVGAAGETSPSFTFGAPSACFPIRKSSLTGPDVIFTVSSEQQNTTLECELCILSLQIGRSVSELRAGVSSVTRDS